MTGIAQMVARVWRGGGVGGEVVGLKGVIMTLEIVYQCPCYLLHSLLHTDFKRA